MQQALNAERINERSVSSNGRGIEICNKKYIFFEDWQRVDINWSKILDHSSGKFIGASTLRGSRWKWNLSKYEEEVSYRRIVERWYGRHVAERRLSAIGREFVVDRSCDREKSRYIGSRQVLWHAHAPLGLNTVDVLFDASSDEIDHIAFFVFFSTFHLFVIYREKPSPVSFLTFKIIPWIAPVLQLERPIPPYILSSCASTDVNRIGRKSKHCIQWDWNCILNQE